MVSAGPAPPTPRLLLARTRLGNEQGLINLPCSNPRAGLDLDGFSPGLHTDTATRHAMVKGCYAVRPGTSKDVPNGLPAELARGGNRHDGYHPPATRRTTCGRRALLPTETSARFAIRSLLRSPSVDPPRPLVSGSEDGAMTLPPMSAETVYQEREDYDEEYSIPLLQRSPPQHHVEDDAR